MGVEAREWPAGGALNSHLRLLTPNLVCSVARVTVFPHIYDFVYFFKIMQLLKNIIINSGLDLYDMPTL